MIKDWTQTEIIALIEDIKKFKDNVGAIQHFLEDKNIQAVVILYSEQRREYAIAIIQGGKYHETKDVNETNAQWKVMMHIDLNPLSSMSIRHRWKHGGI